MLIQCHEFVLSHWACPFFGKQTVTHKGALSLQLGNGRQAH